MSFAKHWSRGLLPHLPDMVGKKVLVIADGDVRDSAGNHWPQLMWDRAVAGIDVVVGTMHAYENHPRPDHRLRYLQWGYEWPVLGEYDVVLCTADYNRWLSRCGMGLDHTRIWQWLFSRVRNGGVFLISLAFPDHEVRADAWWTAVTEWGRHGTVAGLTEARVGGDDTKPLRVVERDGPYEIWCLVARRSVTHADRRDRSTPVPSACADRGAGNRDARTLLAGGGGAAVVAPGSPGASSPVGGSGPTATTDAFGQLVVGETVLPHTVGLRSDATGAHTANAGPAAHRGGDGTEPPGSGAGVGQRPSSVRSEQSKWAIMSQWAIVLGGAACVWEDLLAWEQLYGKHWDGLVVAVNDVGCHWPRGLHHWVTLHPEKLAGWRMLRAQYGHPDGYETWGRATRPVMRELRPWNGGSSGMYGAQVAHHLGCTKVVLCGIPMTATPHFAESTVHDGRPWTGVHGHWRAWVHHKDKMEGWCKSMSGQTQALLGAPTLEWLHDR